MKTFLVIIAIALSLFLYSCPFTEEQNYDKYYDLPHTYLKISLKDGEMCQDVYIQIITKYAPEDSVYCHNPIGPEFNNLQYSFQYKYELEADDEIDFALVDNQVEMQILDIAMLPNQCSLLLFPSKKVDNCLEVDNVPLTIKISDISGNELSFYDGTLTPNSTIVEQCEDVLSEVKNSSKEDVGRCFVGLPLTHTMKFEETTK